MKREGQIKVDSENLFPIIKKWLYSDKDIFIREIVANACDAIKKYQSLCQIGEAENDGSKPRIDIILDKDAKTLTVKDNGIGIKRRRAHSSRCRCHNSSRKSDQQSSCLFCSKHYAFSSL